jgi:hypothetical protein
MQHHNLAAVSFCQANCHLHITLFYEANNPGVRYCSNKLDEFHRHLSDTVLTRISDAKGIQNYKHKCFLLLHYLLLNIYPTKISPTHHCLKSDTAYLSSDFVLLGNILNQPTVILENHHTLSTWNKHKWHWYHKHINLLIKLILNKKYINKAFNWKLIYFILKKYARPKFTSPHPQNWGCEHMNVLWTNVLREMKYYMAFTMSTGPEDTCNSSFLMHTTNINKISYMLEAKQSTFWSTERIGMSVLHSTLLLIIAGLSHMGWNNNLFTLYLRKHKNQDLIINNIIYKSKWVSNAYNLRIITIQGMLYHVEWWQQTISLWRLINYATDLTWTHFWYLGT